MIKKFQSIKHIGKFVDYNPVGDVTFRNINFIYGENGRGKTTLTSILRSLVTNNPIFINERATLGVSPLEQKVDILFNTDTLKFKNNAWSKTASGIEIFDSTFVNENIFSGEYIEHDQKKNLYLFAVGEIGVEFAKKVTEFDTKIRDINTLIEKTTQDINRVIKSGITVDEFIAIKPIADVKDKIIEKKKELEAASKVSTIKSKNLLEEVKIPTLDGVTINALLSKTISGIEKDAEAGVQKHIAECMDRNGSGWIQQGLSYIKKDKCPFCSNDIAGNGLIKAYQSFFNKKFNEFKQEISVESDSFQDSFSSRSIARIESVINMNKELWNFWKDHIARIDLGVLDFTAIESVLGTIEKDFSSLYSQKLASPLDKVLFCESANKSVVKYVDLTTEIETYNKTIKKINQKIEEVKTRTATANITTINNEINLLIDSESRHAKASVALCQKYLDDKFSKKKLDADKKKAKDELDKYTEELFKKHETGINTHLRNFGAGFEITSLKTSYSGGKPSSQYALKINNTQIELGDTSTTGKPCFRTALSNGDKNSLAFAFFLSCLENDQNLKDKVVVFDDPINSLDRHRRTYTIQQIIKISGIAKQVVLMSHDAIFLRNVFNDVSDKGKTKSLCVTRSAGGNLIEEWDLIAETQDQYTMDIVMLHNYLVSGSPAGTDLRSVARCIRPALEGYYRIKFPLVFHAKEWLGNFIGKIKSSKSGDLLFPLMSIVSELSDINSYSSKYHHQMNPDAGSEPVYGTELEVYIKRALALIQK